MTDENNCQHGYGYDRLGWFLADAIYFFSNMDNTLFSIGPVYNERGLVIKRYSFKTDFTAFNEIYYVYNDFNQLIREYQEPNGQVVLSGTGATKFVRYDYEDGATQALTHGTWSTTRLKSMTYPNGTVLSYDYISDQAKALSRPDQMMKNSGIKARYHFLGLGRVVDLIYDEAGATMSYANTYAPNDAGDVYRGLDRFGRIQATWWRKTSTSADLVKSQYGRNAMGSVLWRQDYLAEAAGTNQDTFYTYDPRQQVKTYERGTLVFSGGTPPVVGITPVDSESFDYDPMGNWLNYQTPLTTLPLDQDRGYNGSNQITSITNPSGVIQPVYNPQGDMTLTPSPSDWGTGYDLKWDPWHRLVEVKKHGTTTVIASYTYDAAHRRVTATAIPAGGTTPVTRVSYYDTRWRVVEEWVGATI